MFRVVVHNQPKAMPRHCFAPRTLRLTRSALCAPCVVRYMRLTRPALYARASPPSPVVWPRLFRPRVPPPRLVQIPPSGSGFRPHRPKSSREVNASQFLAGIVHRSSRFNPPGTQAAGRRLLAYAFRCMPSGVCPVVFRATRVHCLIVGEEAKHPVCCRPQRRWGCSVPHLRHTTENEGRTKGDSYPRIISKVRNAA